MAKTSIGTREVRDQSVARNDLDTQTSGQAVISKVLAGTGISLSWTGADPGTGDVTISNASGVSGPVPLDYYELADWYGGQQITATPITLNFDGPRYPNTNFANAGGELEFLTAGPYLVLARVTASITSGTSRSESHMVLEEDTGAGWTTVWGSEAFIYHRNINQGKGTAASMISYNANAGDKIRIRLDRTGGTSTIETEDDGSNLVVVSLTGTMGPQGVQGPAGSAGINGTNGTNGTDGIDGSQIYTGHGIPSNTLGIDNDLYINIDNNEYYQKGSSTAGDWGTPIGTLGSGGGGGVTDHGALTGLGDDDHPQYLTNARGDARYAAIDHQHTLADLGNEVELTLQKIEVLHWMGVN